MKAKSLLKELLIIIITITPLFYYLYLWNSLPEILPMHFDMEGDPDNYGSKNFIGIGLFILTIGFYFFFKFIPKIYSKNSFTISEQTYNKLRLILAFFFSSFYIIIIHSIQQAKVNNTFIFISIALLISLLGNYMRNVRPNHFAGNRFLWSNKDESSWKKTQNFIGKLWFFTGFILIAAILILPDGLRIYAFASGITICMLIMPVIYSFIIHHKNKKANSTKSVKENTESEYSDHWIGLFYVNKNDKRILVPKRVVGMGWTLNFGNPLSIILIIAIITTLIITSYF